MVQRKVPNKLGIQADHVKSDKLLANLKASSSQYQDGKNRGADLKKKMKKTRSIKLSDIESLRSSPMKRHISQPGKPPPLGVPATATIPQKQQPLIKATDGSPNYMKSTSCFDARKEQSQVSLRNTQTGSESKNMSRRSSSNSNVGSASGNKPARALTRPSSLKLMRTLTKIPSFKPARASAKKSSRVVLCADMNAQRTTCSSTLKDSKFPAYLMLSPGATESEGTSVMKVCRYTYCSLNGHRHSPLPPLKCFLSARRRWLKTQKSMKMEAPSPRRAKPSSEETEEIDTPKLIFEDRPAHKDADFGNLASPPLLQDVGIDFFIEIYAKSKNNDTESMGKGTRGDKEEIPDVDGDVEDQNVTMSSIDWGDEAVAEYRYKQVAETLCDGSAQSEVDLEENLEQYGNMTATEMDTAENFTGEQVEDADEDVLALFAQGKTTMGTFCTGSDFEGEWDGSEVTDMEWEEGHLTGSEQDNEADYSIETGDESDVNVGCSLDKNPDFHNEYVVRSDDVVSSCNEVMLADVLRELFAEEGACSEAQSNNGDSELDALHQILEIHEFSQASFSLNCNQISSIEDAFEESKNAEEENGQSETKLISTEIPSALIEEQIVETTATSEDNHEKNRVVEADNLIPEIDPQLGNDEGNCISKTTDEASNDEQMHTTLQDDGNGMEDKEQADDAKILVEIQASDFSWCYSEADQIDTEVKANKNHKRTLACHPDDTAKDWNSSEQIDDDSFTEETQNNQSEGLKSKILVDDAKILVEIQASDFSWCYSEADQIDTEVKANKNHKRTLACHPDDTAKDWNSSEQIDDDSFTEETQNNQSEGHPEGSSVIEDQILEKGHSEANSFKISSSKDDERPSNPRMNKSNSAKESIEEVEKMELEDNTEPDAADVSTIANGITSPETETTFFPGGSDSTQQPPDACNSQKWTTRCKRRIEDEDETRKFNPREPNYLPLVPDREAKKVDLRHQMMDERKNAEEWMLDYHIQQAVTKLAPARKRKVALLVEAFETVMPTSKCETHSRSTEAFVHARPMQACS